MKRQLTDMERLWLRDLRRVVDLYEEAETDPQALAHTGTGISLWSTLRGFLLQKVEQSCLDKEQAQAPSE